VQGFTKKGLYVLGVTRDDNIEDDAFRKIAVEAVLASAPNADRATVAAWAEQFVFFQDVDDDYAPLVARIEQLEREKSAVEAFAAMAAHELVEPLVMTEAFAAIVSDRLDGDGHAESLADLDAMGRAAARTRRLVETLLHEAGHTEHFAHVTPDLSFERRFLGDNSFTEAFAFLFQYLAEEPAWLEEVLDVDGAPLAGYAKAVKLIFLRRYSAKLGYERRLHAEDADLTKMPDEYVRRLSAAVHVDWPRESWIADVDPFFYAACYIRAWATERTLRAHLVDQFGERWFTEPAAGDVLKRIWSKGQRALAEELLVEIGAEPVIDLAVLT
jgi:hypothetical protein